MKLRIGMSQRINIAGYESIQPLVELEDEFSDNDKLDESYYKLRSTVTDLWYKELERQVQIVVVRDKDPEWQKFLEDREIRRRERERRLNEKLAEIK